MNKTFEILPPQMPNFIFYKVPARPRQEGFNPDANKIPISDLSEKEADDYADLMRRTFLEHWRKSCKQLTSDYLLNKFSK